mgnify:CR=1 FL=1
MTVVIEQNVLYERLRQILDMGWIEIPQVQGYGGTGAPGKILEELLEIDGGNHDLPDAGKWEVKFHGGSSPITLFHKEPEPRGNLEDWVVNAGWEDEKGRMSLRHTVWGASELGFKVRAGDQRIVVINENYKYLEPPFWLNDTLINAFVQKLRRLILVSGKKKGNSVKYVKANLFWEPKATQFINAILAGLVAIDFDARTKSHTREIDGGKLRNHGTKFRIKRVDLEKLYHKKRDF